MYEQYWGLSVRPFENTLDDSRYYPAETHQAALLKLSYAIENRRAAALLCGPTGMGKSMIVDLLKKKLEQQFSPVCSIVFPVMSAEQLVRYMVERLDGSAAEAIREASADLVRFENFLCRNLAAKRHAVVVIDEAHLLEHNDLLEPLRLMLNVAACEAPGESAWTLLLVGQPTLLSHVERYHALDERLAVKCMLNRFLPEETTAYIQHRLRLAGVDCETIFDYPAIERVHCLTQGIPRRINRLCDLALMVGYAEEHRQLTAEIIDNVHHDLAAPSLV